MLNFVARFCCGTQEWCWKLAFFGKKTWEERLHWKGGISPGRECSASCISCPWKRPRRKNSLRMEAVGVLAAAERMGICYYREFLIGHVVV